MEEKAAEYQNTPDKIDDLLAELKLGEALSRHLKIPMEFQTGEASDIVWRDDGIECTVEVEHKSTTQPFASVFYPDPDMLGRYEQAGAETWQGAAVRLHKVVKELPIEIEPFISGELDEPRWSGKEREEKERCCGEIASWLADQLAASGQSPQPELVHKVARFKVKRLESPPGRIAGATSDSPSRIRIPDGRGGGAMSMCQWLRSAVNRKAEKAIKHRERCGQHHLIALVVDDAYASEGWPLTQTLLGGLIYDHDEKRPYRGVPAKAQSLYLQSRKRGRSNLLDLAQYDPNECPSGTAGVFFEKHIRAAADGVVALYYTGKLQALLNPFTSKDIEPLLPLFPATLHPFPPGHA